MQQENVVTRLLKTNQIELKDVEKVMALEKTVPDSEQTFQDYSCDYQVPFSQKNALYEALITI